MRTSISSSILVIVTSLSLLAHAAIEIFEIPNTQDKGLSDSLQDNDLLSEIEQIHEKLDAGKYKGHGSKAGEKTKTVTVTKSVAPAASISSIRTIPLGTGISLSSSTRGNRTLSTITKTITVQPTVATSGTNSVSVESDRSISSTASRTTHISSVASEASSLSTTLLPSSPASIPYIISQSSIRTTFQTLPSSAISSSMPSSSSISTPLSSLTSSVPRFSLTSTASSSPVPVLSPTPTPTPPSPSPSPPPPSVAETASEATSLTTGISVSQTTDSSTLASTTIEVSSLTLSVQPDATAAAEIDGAGGAASAIDISTFKLQSSLVLGNLVQASAIPNRR